MKKFLEHIREFFIAIGILEDTSHFDIWRNLCKNNKLQ